MNGPSLGSILVAVPLGILGKLLQWVEPKRSRSSLRLSLGVSGTNTRAAYVLTVDRRGHVQGAVLRIGVDMLPLRHYTESLRELLREHPQMGYYEVGQRFSAAHPEVLTAIQVRAGDP